MGLGIDILVVFRELHPVQVAARMNRWVARQHSPIEVDGSLFCPRCREDYPCEQLVRVIDRIEELRVRSSRRTNQQ